MYSFVYLVRVETVLAHMVEHLSHVQGELTFELEAYNSYELALSEIAYLKGRVEELMS